MVASITQFPIGRREDGRQQQGYAGEVVYIYGYDVAYELSREPITELLGQKVVPFEFDVTRRNPRHHFFYKPQMVRLPPIQRAGPHGPVELERVVKLLPVGAISITVRVPFEVATIDQLVAYHDLHLETGSLNSEVRLLAEQVRRELEPFCARPVPKLMDEEAYTVFCVEAPLTTHEGHPLAGEAWFKGHRRQVAALLTQETDVTLLSNQEADESTGRYLSYYQNDLVVVDWDAALLIDERGDWDESLYVMELANLQLAELEAYDRMLDDCLERSYRDLGQRRFRGRLHVLHELREMRIDMARFSDELMNITKFFGDWHLARLYENIAARFHLVDWHHTIDEKLKTLDGLYEILKHDQNNRWMLGLEVTIVLLFVIDLIILFLGFK
ncbi:MAG: hypothetical protein QOF48_1151 [Verrucomicrobiota bacterium]|jgi:hypothetical protein